MAGWFQFPGAFAKMRAIRNSSLKRSYRLGPQVALLLMVMVIDSAVAQVIPQCYIESIPCGTPDDLYRKVSECLKDPSQCGVLPRPRDSRVPATAASGRKFILVSADARAGRQTRVSAPVRPITATASTAGDIESGEKQSDAMPRGEVDLLADNLPLDAATRNLSNTIPADAGAIELRLGLRRTRVAAIDMRSRTPTAQEIIDALAPRAGAQR